MQADQQKKERWNALYGETMELIQSIDMLTERVTRLDSKMTDAEAEQSLECLRSDLSRLSEAVETTKKNERGTQATDSVENSNSVLPILLGGMAVGALIEKPLGGDF